MSDALDTDLAHVVRMMPTGLYAKLLEWAVMLDQIQHKEPIVMPLGSYRLELHRTQPRKCPTCGRG